MGGLRTLSLGTKRPLRVVAYCRVSTDDDTQDGSYETQLEFFGSAIEDHPDWIFAGLYADYARSGTQTKGRPDFLRMLRHAEGGCFDYILAKSISRFSRSAADTLKYIQMFSGMGIGVYFLEQGFDTLQQNSGIMLSALSAVAELEAESISKNVKLTLDAKNRLGKPVRKCCYGYGKKDRKWEVIPKQAIRVKLGFLMAASGYSYKEIAERLNSFEQADLSGREWDSAMVLRMLKNEAYIGDLLTNKKATVRDPAGSKRQVVNNGESDMFYIDSHHEPLVGRQVFKAINEMIDARELAGQERFRGVDRVRPMALRDPLLREVKRLLPFSEGKYMERLRRLNPDETDEADEPGKPNEPVKTIKGRDCDYEES